MRYQGSKKRIAKSILEIIHDNIGERCYIEPFMGGCNIFSRVVADKKIGSDYNEYTFAIWKGLQDGTLIIPDYISKEEYYKVCESYKNKDGAYTNAVIGMVGFLASFGGRFMNGYANFNPKRGENHVKEALNGLRKDWDGFKCKENTTFLNLDYTQLVIPKGSALIYCDPPYQDTLSYKESGNGFDSEKFWDWCRKQEMNDNIVIASEYNSPSDFICIWQKELPCGMNTDEGKKQSTRIEKLFVHQSRFNRMALKGDILVA